MAIKVYIEPESKHDFINLTSTATLHFYVRDTRLTSFLLPHLNKDVISIITQYVVTFSFDINVGCIASWGVNSMWEPYDPADTAHLRHPP